MAGVNPTSLRTIDELEKELTSWRSERFWIFGALFVLCGILLAALDPWLLQPSQINILGLVLFATALGSIALARVHFSLGALSLMAGSLIAVWLLINALSTPGTLALLVLPVMLAALTLGWQTSCWLSCGLSILLITQPFGLLSVGNVSDLAVAIFLVNLIWLTSWFNESTQETIAKPFFGYYQQAQRLLEEARDQRLMLNQTNEELAEAYRQVMRLNQLLRASQAETESARRAKEEFVANVSHELRTPLNMIIGFSEMMLNAHTANNRLSNTLVADMGVIYRNSQHLAQLIDDVLDLSQIESGQFTLSRSWGDIGEIVREATQAVEPLFLAKGLTLTSVQSVPAPPLFFDRLRIRQIVLNLLSNSGRFTTTGGATLAISFDHRELVVAVSDTGPGIRPEDQGKVFEPFQQLESSTRRTHDGSGLGLSISQRLVELHGGRMWLQSEVGVGSTFLFSLPLRADQSVRSDVSRWFNPYTSYIERPRRVIDLPKPKPQILLLERGNVLHHQLNHYLGEIEVIAVQTIAELNLALSSAIPNTILINDPQVMADWGLLRRTVDLPARTPVISCYVPSAQEAYEQLNVVNYLVKPVLRDQLLAAIAQIAPTKSTILVVEDSPEMAHLIVRQLTSAGQDYRVLRASDGQRALAFMRERQPDAVLLDLGLPDLDGYQVLQEKNADHRIRSIPVIIVSARDPFGDPVVTNRLRIELAGGLSVRDILLSTTAIGRALSPLKRKLGAE